MLSALGAWFASQGVNLLLGFAANVIASAIRDWRQAQAASDLGRLSAERDQALAAGAAREAELQAALNAPTDIEAAVARLDGGSA